MGRALEAFSLEENSEIRRIAIGYIEQPHLLGCFHVRFPLPKHKGG